MLVCSRAGAVDVIPVYRGHLMGGQYFLKGTNASLSGNAALLAAPVLEFNERWSLIPVYGGNYQGTKGVADGVRAGSLFQQQMDHRVSFTGIYSVMGTAWKVKPTGGYKRYFLKETRDETWGRGLFDWEKINVGFELENAYREPFSYRAGFEAFRIRFPNYESLESQVGTDPSGNPLGREQASKNPLDTYNYQVSLSGSRPFPYDNPVVSLSAAYSILYQFYPDQRIVNRAGQFQENKPHKRGDFLNSVSLGVGYPKTLGAGKEAPRLNTSFSVTASHNGSNQNTFDAARTMYIHDSYSYYSWGAGPGVSLGWGDQKQPSSVGLGFQFTRTGYIGRQAQNADGLYLNRHQVQDRYVTSLAYSYPLAPGFNLKTAANALWATSNNYYEKTYSYTYRTANYTMGITYEY